MKLGALVSIGKKITGFKLTRFNAAGSVLLGRLCLRAPWNNGCTNS